MNVLELVENPEAQPNAEKNAIWAWYLPVMSANKLAIKLPYYYKPITYANFIVFVKEHHELYVRSCHTLKAADNVASILKKAPSDIYDFYKTLAFSLFVSYDKVVSLNKYITNIFRNRNTFFDFLQTFELISTTSLRDIFIKPYGVLPLAKYFGAEWAKGTLKFSELDTSKFDIYTNEAGISTQIKQLKDIIKLNAFTEKNPRKYTNNDLKISIACSSLSEPIPKSTGRTAMYASRTLVSWLSIFSGYLQDDYIDFLKRFFSQESNSWHVINQYLTYAILPVFEGKAPYESHNKVIKLIKTFTEYLFKQDGNGSSYKWISTENIFNHLLLNPEYEYLKVIYSRIAYCQLDKFDQLLESNDIINLIYPLFVKALFLQLSVLGLTEVAIDRNKQATLSDIKYVRPTKLLAYVTGRTENYTIQAPVIDNPPAIQLSADSMIIISNDAKGFKVIEGIIDSKLTKLRASVTFSSLLSSHIQGKLEQDIDILKKLAKIDVLPRIWEDTINEVRNTPIIRLNRIQQTQTYCIGSHYKLIRSMILNDKQLSKLVSFGERNTVVISWYDTSKFIGTLAKHGIGVASDIIYYHYN